MKKIPRWLSSIFSPKDLLGLDAGEVLDALNDGVIRKTWLYDVFEELKRLNLEIDKRLLSESQFHVQDLAARRKALQFVLEAVLSAKRQVSDHNPQKGEFDLDSVTVQPAPR